MEEVICNCPKTDCPRHGDCAACELQHSKKRYPPYCKRQRKQPTRARRSREEDRKP